MRIVHVVQRFAPAVGGAETHVQEVAQEQARRGHAVTVVTSAAEGRAQREELDGVEVVRFPARHWRGDYLFPPWLRMPRAAAFLGGCGADVLHAHSYRFDTVERAAAASRSSGIPLVVTAHGFYPPENAAVALSRAVYDRLRGRAALGQAARCVAVTEHERAHFEALGVAASRVDVVPNGLPERAFERVEGAAFRARHGLVGPLVVFLARLAHDKGVRDFVRAAAHVPEATFALCGRDAGEEAAARRLAGRNVRFIGAVDDPREAYAAADVFCLPSHYEAFGIVLAEAMAQGTPVVSTTAGGIPEVVGGAGVLVPPRDPQALGGALRALLMDPARGRELGECGRAQAARYRWSDVVTRLEEVYARALHG